MSARILIIEDDLTLSEQVAGLLRSKGFIVDQCTDGQQGLLTALREKFDLILLDVLLPTTNGFSVLHRLREARQTPVMMLTACGAEQERIEGYSKGADDYLSKPFNFKEMLLRIEALLRRANWRSETTVQRHAIVIDELSLCRRNQKICFADQPIDVTPIQFRLLWVLTEKQGQVLSKAYLYQVVLERAFSRYDRSLDMHLSRVRRKLVEAGMSSERLVTVHGKGYLFS